MSAQHRFTSNKEFWAGVAATIAVGILLAIAAPYLMRSRMSKQERYQTMTGLAAVTDDAAYESHDKLTTVSLISSSEQDRKMIRTGSLDMLVKNPKEASEKIRLVAEQAGGFLVASETHGRDSSSASLTVRVPVDRFEQVRAQITSLGMRVESEKREAEDVTKQYVDQSARLRNLHAQETQYLGILQQAKTVKDTLEVSDKLNEVRGEIEQQQAEFEALSKQVETVAVSISLRAEADTQVLGLHWRPLYQLKIAAREGIDGIGDYAAAMASFLFYLPTVLLWLATILIGAAVGWRILRRTGGALFVTRVKAA
jgi:hypothetical protein